jgi:PAS domain S-box-containing protein
MGSRRGIAQRKRADSARWASPRSPRSALDALSSHIAILDEHGTIIEVNAAWTRFAAENHFPGGGGLGNNYLKVCDSAAANRCKDAAAVAIGIRAVIAGRSGDFNLEYPCHAPDEKRWFNVRVTRFGSEGPGRVVVAHENITERRLTEARFRRLADANVQGVIFANMKGEIIKANDAFLRLVGYTRRDMEAGRLNWAALSPPEYADADRRAVAETIATGVFTPYEKEYLRKDGGRVPILIGGAAFEDDSGEGVCFIIDLTQRKRAEEALKDSQMQLRALSVRLQSAREEESERIAREIHDELGQVLTRLNMDIIWIRQKLEAERSPLLRPQFQRRMQAATALLEATVRSVHRISAELRPAMLDDLGLTATLEWQAEEFAARTGIPCSWEAKPAAPQLNRHQATALYRIFQEIMTNVARHAQASAVKLKLVHDQGELILEVADDGKGFAENKMLPHKSLGLLGMRERAAFIGGRVEVCSAPGKGTRITVTSAVVKTGGRKKSQAGHSPNKNHKHSHRR